MRKLSFCLIVAVLLMSLAPFAMAAGSASLTGPSTVRAGDTITLTFSAGGDILGGSGSLSYDSSQLTLVGCTPLIGGSWEVSFAGNNFFFIDNSLSSPVSYASIFSATFQVNSSLTPGTAISVSANNIVLSAGTEDMGVGSRTYSAVIAAPLSDNCNLKSMTVSNAQLSPAFSPDVTRYTASVPYTTSSLNLSAEADHAGAKVDISNPGLTPGGVTTVQVTVTAETGAVKTYTISVTRAQDPNYVPSSNADLSSLAVEGWQLSPAFDPATTQYYVWLPYEAETVEVSAQVADPLASLHIDPADTLQPGVATDVTVTVTAEDGTVREYVIGVFRAPAHADTPDFLAGDRPEVTEPETEPTEPETEPVTEPETEPTTEPTVEPTAEPTEPEAEPAPQNTGDGPSILWVIVAAVAGLAIGVAVGMFLKKKKQQED